MLKIAFDKTYIHPLGENHRFPMIKYELIPEQLIRKNTNLENAGQDEYQSGTMARELLIRNITDS